MRKPTKNSITKFSVALFTYISIAIYGWQIISFIIIYSGMNESVITERMSKVLEWQLYFIIPGITIGLFYLLILFKFSSIDSYIHIQWKKLVTHIKMQLLFYLCVLINLFLFLNQSHINILDLLSFIFAIFLLYHLGSVFYFPEGIAWYHPTTRSIFFLTSILKGFAFILILDVFESLNRDFLYWILVLLIFDLLILYTRFKYLSQASISTRSIAKKLLGTYMMYFGVRIILGIFMPIIYILYSLLFQPLGIRSIGVLLVISTFIDRFLFMIEGEKQP